MASSAPVPLHVPAAPEAADAEQLQAQQQALLTLGCRTMALPIGRGALTLGRSGVLLLPQGCAALVQPTGVLPRSLPVCVLSDGVMGTAPQLTLGCCTMALPIGRRA